MSRTEYDPTPHVPIVPRAPSASRPHPDLSSEDIEPRHALAAFVKVALAVQARAIQRARDVAQAAPEVRVARVEATRRALYDGTLTLHGQGLAEKLLEAVRAERRHA